MKILLRNTRSGLLENHHFLNKPHAQAWLKGDKKNESRYTVCLCEEETVNPGYFEETEMKVREEMTVQEFLGEDGKEK